MDFKDYIQGKREILTVPLPPILTILLLQRRLKEYGFDVPIDLLRRLRYKDVCRIFIFMNNVTPEDVNLRTMLDKLTIATILGGGDKKIEISEKRSSPGVVIEK